MICHLKTTLRTSHLHTCSLSTYYAVVGPGENAVGTEKNVAFTLKKLTGPYGKQTNQINLKIMREEPQILHVWNTERIQNEEPGKASWKSRHLAHALQDEMETSFPTHGYFGVK